MTHDEMERTMQFILQQQAQFQEDIRQLDKRHGQLQDAVITITGVVGRLGEAQTEFARLHQELARSHQELARSHQELAKAQVHTEERLSAFITFVERYISEAGRN